MKCACCACENPAHAQFCMRCGAPVGSAVTQPVTVPYAVTSAGKRSPHRLRAALIVAGLLALAGGGFALTRALLTPGHLVQSPEIASVPGPLTDSGGRITDTGPLTGHSPLPSPPQPADVTAYPQNAPGVGGYPSGNLVQTPGMSVPTGPLTERAAQIADASPLTERGNYLPNAAPLTERAGPIPPIGSVTDRNAHLPAVTPPTERADRVPETTPPVERRIPETPPAAERAETPPPRPPAEVVNYLRFLKEIETRRVMLAKQHIGVSLQQLVEIMGGNIQAMMDEHPEIRHRQINANFHRALMQMSREWQALNRLFRSRHAPQPCRVLQARYFDVLRNCTGAVGILAHSVGQALSSNPMALLGSLPSMGGSGLASASRAVTEACQAANAELAAVCKRFQLSKDFEIQDE